MPYLRQSLIAAGLLFVLTDMGLDAHGPVLRIDKQTAAPGDMITVSGEGLSDGGAVDLTLRGILQDYALGVIEKTDEHGRFERQVTPRAGQRPRTRAHTATARTETAVSTDLRPGEYTLVASGKETATTKLAIVEVAAAAASAPAEAADHEEPVGVGGHDHGSEAEEVEHASAEPMDIERPKTGLERTVTWGSVLLAAIVGLGLLIWKPSRLG